MGKHQASNIDGASFFGLGLTFEIVDGGFNDIDIKITDPLGKVIHEAERESSGKYTFGASSAGAYT